MPISNQTLWKQLSQFQIDEGDPELTFIGRLAKENLWDISYAERVYKEYLRFLYLSSVSDGLITPSDAVDQAWHLHLSYTRSYWNNLCVEILRTELHHAPTRGGRAELERFTAAYAKTLTLYQQNFDTPPPRDIWPTPENRFVGTPSVRVNPSTMYLLPRRQARRLGVYLAIAALVLILAALLLGWNDAFGIAAFAVIGGLFWYVLRHRKKFEGDIPSQCGVGGCGTS